MEKVDSADSAAADNFWQLFLAAEVSPEKGRALLEALGPIPCIDQQTFAAHPLLSPGEASRVRNVDLATWREAKALGLRIVYGERLPAKLKAAPDHPLALFTLGNSEALNAPCVGIVGTRNASAYGKGVAKKFAAGLAESGVTIVSGGALGIDSSSHEGALSTDGATVAVLAGGLDKPYPSRNAGLFRKICGSGCLVSTYSWGTLPERHKFLERNEVIAALCDAILVVEAPARSGALSTAFAARRFGRPVFVAPANIEAESFRGSHALIRSGAMLVDHPPQVAEALGIQMKATAAPEPATGLAAKILAAMTTAPISGEKLADKLGLPPQELMAELTMLELEGRVTRELGGYALVP